MTLPKTPSFRLDGKRALVTGASSGIGQACAVALAEAGAHVVCAARGAERLAATVEEMQASGWSAEALQLLPAKVVEYSGEMNQMLRALKDFLFERMYRHYRLMRMQTKAERFVCEIFEAYVKEPKMLPGKTQLRLEETVLERVITDYIAGMTDDYFLRKAKSIGCQVPQRKSLPD